MNIPLLWSEYTQSCEDQHVPKTICEYWGLVQKIKKQDDHENIKKI